MNAEKFKECGDISAIDVTPNFSENQMNNIVLAASGTNWNPPYQGFWKTLRQKLKVMVERNQLGHSFAPIVKSEINGHWISSDQYVREQLNQKQVRFYGHY